MKIVTGLLRAAGLTATLALILSAGLSPAVAQQLSDGDYELCSVYDRNGDFVGYDSACLAEQRAAIRYYGGGGQASAYYCPSWANGGRGYNMTWYSDGSQPSYAGTFDSTNDGRPCVSNPSYSGTGYY